MSYQFTVNSKSLTPGEMVPERYLYKGMGCQGGNISPQIQWQGAPSETRSFALTLFDPDAPTPHGWWHWGVVNIPNNISSIEEGASNTGNLPRDSQELMTDFKVTGYGGPCPPEGDQPHRYIFTVYALGNDKLDVDTDTTAQMLKDRLEKTSLANAVFTVKYGR
jgi:Raf kinase inhibitor-like YbhB/YbcL family protein